MAMRILWPKPMGCSKNSTKSDIYSNTTLPKEMRKTSNNLTLQINQLEKEQKTPKASRRKEIIKIFTLVEVNEKWRKLLQRPVKLKVGSLRR